MAVWTIINEQSCVDRGSYRHTCSLAHADLVDTGCAEVKCRQHCFLRESKLTQLRGDRSWDSQLAIVCCHTKHRTRYCMTVLLTSFRKYFIAGCSDSGFSWQPFPFYYLLLPHCAYHVSGRQNYGCSGQWSQNYYSTCMQFRT